MNVVLASRGVHPRAVEVESPVHGDKPRGSLLALLILFVIAPSFSAQQSAGEMVPIKYDQLKREVAKYHGKVLIVDFWAGY